jgi:hypothetical protein
MDIFEYNEGGEPGTASCCRVQPQTGHLQPQTQILKCLQYLMHGISGSDVATKPLVMQYFAAPTATACGTSRTYYALSLMR